MLLHFQKYKYFSFCLTRKPHPKFCQILEAVKKTPVPETPFHKVAGLSPATLLKKSLLHRCFPVNFAKFLRTPFLQNTSGRLLQKHLQWGSLLRAL